MEKQCIDKKYSKLIKLYIEDDGRFCFWTLCDHAKYAIGALII